jgi:hypothetical protein
MFSRIYDLKIIVECDKKIGAAVISIINYYMKL